MPGPETPEEKAERIRAELQMPHLKDARRDAEEAAGKKAPPSVQNDPRMQERYAFAFDWRDMRGKRWHGNFLTKILSIGERKMVGTIMAKQAGQAPVESLTGEAFQLIRYSTWCELALLERPDWAKDLDALYDPMLLQKIFEEVAAHHRTFLGDEPAADSGAGAS